MPEDKALFVMKYNPLSVQ